ncbi:unnamed protein product [Cylindrotheca closterium]|uniref:Uncharacterized protein n=1 Tax=Cylindrotheca closterium TaxID=2856 RepID=A0AAD2CKK1_9STRA|nr:unnamed protein product [Cylindrotheca closterium]
MTVRLPSIKRDRLLKLISETLANPSLSLRDITILLGHVSTETTVCRWMRCSYFNLQRVLSQFLQSRHQSIKHYMKRNGKVQIISDQLPPSLCYRLASLIGKEAATFLWNANKRFRLDEPVLRELRAIKHSLKTETWEIYILQMIPQDPHFTSYGDASFLGGGAYSDELLFWFRIVWSPDIVAGTKLKASNPKYVHINSLEFLVAFLQEVAKVVRLEGTSHAHPGLAHKFPNGFSHFPVLLNRTDNTPTEKWMNDAHTNSPFARLLVNLHGQLLKRSSLTALSDHIPGDDNFAADFISRPNMKLSHHQLLSQTFCTLPWMRNYDYVQPSPKLCSVLRSCLFSNPKQAPPMIPANLGHFVPADSISSSFAMI